MSVWQVLLFMIVYPLLQRFIAPIVSLEPWFSFAPYVGFWLMLPYEWRSEVNLLLSALFGLILDTFFPPHGLYTFCGLSLWAIRGLWLSVLFQRQPDKGLIAEMTPTEWVTYALPLVMAYMLLYFALQDLSLMAFVKGILSGAYSFLGTWVIFASIRNSDARRT